LTSQNEFIGGKLPVKREKGPLEAMDRLAEMVRESRFLADNTPDLGGECEPHD
jgi:hypothetical protein